MIEVIMQQMQQNLCYVSGLLAGKGAGITNEKEFELFAHTQQMVEDTISLTKELAHSLECVHTLPEEEKVHDCGTHVHLKKVFEDPEYTWDEVKCGTCNGVVTRD